jgi:predicted ATPase
MELLERGAFLESLESWLAAARSGEGCMVLLGGEAGIGRPRHEAGFISPF